MVYNDLLQNPLIVPVKKLTGHTKYDDFGVMAVSWHPTQPWLFSAGADGYIKLMQKFRADLDRRDIDSSKFIYQQGN